MAAARTIHPQTKEIEMTAEEAVLHIKKIVDAFNEEYNDMGVVEQMRHGGDMAEEAIRDIEHILNDTQISQ